MSATAEGIDRRPRLIDRALSAAVLLGFLVLCYGTAALAAWATLPEIDTWYRGIAKPSWTPPDRVFGPVWAVLYGTMAIAAWLVWREHLRIPVGGAMRPFFVQLALNLAWSFLFFRWHRPDLAVADIALLWVAIGATVVAFAVRRLAAGVLLLPYWAWAGFAALLNATVWRMND